MRMVDLRDPVRITGAGGENDIRRAGEPRRNDGAVEHEMWIRGKENLVLCARGLALGAVRDDDGRAAPGDGAQLRRRREARAAAAGETARFDLREQPLARERRERLVVVRALQQPWQAGVP